jgi:Leucine-rich repeat (LRR) protein
LKFPGLKTIYVHGNKIADLSEVDKLSKLKNLTAFTIHGNPVETLAGFRHYILTKLPNLKHLNFSGISKADRQTAITWIKSNNKPTKVEAKVEEKPKKKNEEQ